MTLHSIFCTGADTVQVDSGLSNVGRIFGVRADGDLLWYQYTGNRRNDFTYDVAGNLINDGTQTFAYDATGQQTSAASTNGGGGGSAPVFTDDPLVRVTRPAAALRTFPRLPSRAASREARRPTGASR